MNSLTDCFHELLDSLIILTTSDEQHQTRVTGWPICLVKIKLFLTILGCLTGYVFLHTILKMASMIYYRPPSKPFSTWSFVTDLCLQFLHLYSCSHQIFYFYFFIFFIFNVWIVMTWLTQQENIFQARHWMTAKYTKLLWSKRKLEGLWDFQYLSFCNAEQIS